MALRPNQAPYERQKAAIMANPAISYWLKAAVEQLEKRDPIDAVSDAGFLFGLAEARANEAIPAMCPACGKDHDAMDCPTGVQPNYETWSTESARRRVGGTFGS